MSPRRTGAAAGRHAGDRLLSSLAGSGDAPRSDAQPDAMFVYTDPSEPPLPARSPPKLLALRFRTGFRATLLIGVLCVLGAGGFWWQALSGRSEVVPLNVNEAPVESLEATDPAASSEPVQGSPGGLPSGGSAGTDAMVIVHVAGAVNAPGVVSLPAGSRVNDAILAAGGPSPVSDPGRLNLAAVVADGQKIFVPEPGEELPAELAGAPPQAAAPIPGTPGDSGAGSTAAGDKVNLNTATPSDLETLPKVGPVLAQKIVDWRLEHGPFATVEELDAVDGVGPKMMETLMPLVTV